jgi:hypothetical protein
MGSLAGNQVRACSKAHRKLFLDRFKDAAASACRAVAISSLFAVSALAAQIPSRIMFTPGVDIYKEAVRNHLKSTPVSSYSSEIQMDVNAMQTMGSASPYNIRDPPSGMMYSVWISHGFFSAGGDSLKYVIKYDFRDFRTSLRARKWAWEINAGIYPHTNISWSSGHPSYIPSDASQFRIMQCSHVCTADLIKFPNQATGTATDSNRICSPPLSLSFNHAWNYGYGNWGGKRRWIGITGTDVSPGAATFFNGAPEDMHQIVRLLSYPIPNPGHSGEWLAWVGDTVFWKANPADTNAQYDVMARVDSLRFVFAVLDQNFFYKQPYASALGQTYSVTVKPYDVYNLPVPDGLAPFSGYGGRKGSLINTSFQFANITPPESFDKTIHTLSAPAFEAKFFQDSIARTGPWTTLMKGRMRFGGTAQDPAYKMVTDSATPQFCADSLVMWRFIKIPAAGDTARLTLGDEYSMHFRVPDSLYGAEYPYDPLICGFLYGANYTDITSSRNQGRALLLPGQARHVGEGRYEISFGDNALHRVSVIDMRGRTVSEASARSVATIDFGRMGLPPGIYIISLSERGRAMPITAAYVR